MLLAPLESPTKFSRCCAEKCVTLKSLGAFQRGGRATRSQSTSRFVTSMQTKNTVSTRKYKVSQKCTPVWQTIKQ